MLSKLFLIDFIIGWLLSSTATNILKTVINHTKNIQSKDIERLPYPVWVKNKNEVITYVKNIINNSINEVKIDNNYQNTINKFFE